jgi:hypothetical protein
VFQKELSSKTVPSCAVYPCSAPVLQARADCDEIAARYPASTLNSRRGYLYAFDQKGAPRSDSSPSIKGLRTRRRGWLAVANALKLLLDKMGMFVAGPVAITADA